MLCLWIVSLHTRHHKVGSGLSVTGQMQPIRTSLSVTGQMQPIRTSLSVTGQMQPIRTSLSVTGQMQPIRTSHLMFRAKSWKVSNRKQLQQSEKVSNCYQSLQSGPSQAISNNNNSGHCLAPYLTGALQVRIKPQK